MVAYGPWNAQSMRSLRGSEQNSRTGQGPEGFKGWRENRQGAGSIIGSGIARADPGLPKHCLRTSPSPQMKEKEFYVSLCERYKCWGEWDRN